MKIWVYYIGKARDANLNAFAAEFVKRTSRFAQIEMREIQPSRFDPFAKHPSAAKILLDPGGKPFSSSEFSELIARAEREGRDQVFAIGGHDGLPPAWRPRADLVLSLSSMTFSHELARALLAEQLYRAFTMLRGHPYPR